jgi:hypothetical protein
MEVPREPAIPRIPTLILEGSSDIKTHQQRSNSNRTIFINRALEKEGKIGIIELCP